MVYELDGYYEPGYTIDPPEEAEPNGEYNGKKLVRDILIFLAVGTFLVMGVKYGIEKINEKRDTSPPSKVESQIEKMVSEKILK